MTTTKEVVDFFRDHGIAAEVRDDGNYALIIITDNTVPDNVKYAFDNVRPVGVNVHYSIRDRNKVPVPAALRKWYIDTAKSMK